METEDTVSVKAWGTLLADADGLLLTFQAQGWTEDVCKIVSSGDAHAGVCPDASGMIGTSPRMLGG